MRMWLLMHVSIYIYMRLLYIHMYTYIHTYVYIHTLHIYIHYNCIRTTKRHDDSEFKPLYHLPKLCSKGPGCL